jgi:F0F1-type ATP synthase assembly protein I
MPQELPDEPKSGTDGSKLSGIGFEFAAAVGGFTFAGYLWDRHFGSLPWGTLTGAILGLIGGMYNLIHQTLRVIRKPGGGTNTTRGDGER